MYHVSGSDAISRDMNSVLFSSTFKHPSEGEFAKIKQLIASDPTPNYHHQSPLQPQPVPPPPTQQQQQQQQSSLLRYRSAPSSFFANLIDGTTGDDVENGCDDFLNSLSSSSTEPVSKRFFTDESRDLSRFPTILKQEERDSFPPPQNQQEDYVMYGNNSRAVDLPNHSSGLNVESSFRVGNSTSSNLIRQSSSPAGFLSSLNVENGITVMRDVGTPSSSSRLINHINFSTGPSSGSRFLPQIAENGHETIGLGSPENGHMVNGNDVNRGYDPSTHNDSWNDSAFNSLKRDRNGDLKMFSGLNGFDTQNGDSKRYTPSLVHHLSLPKTSSEMAAVEKFLQFQQESVPCKIRAKRGYATHPRSIAERVRRTRISERMRKLQELFPNMDKQTNTADMLDLAVEYIKDLQKEVKTLTDTRAKCTCLRTEKLSSIPTE